MIVWKGIYQQFLVIYSLGNQTDRYKTKQNNSIGLPCLVELDIHTDLSTQSHSLWLENMSGMHHKIQAEGPFGLFIQSNDRSGVGRNIMVFKVPQVILKCTQS